MKYKIFLYWFCLLGISRKVFFIRGKLFNPKTVGEGVNLTTPVILRNESFKEGPKPISSVTFNIILSHTFAENFIEVPQGRSDVMKNFSVSISYFHQFSSIFSVFGHF